MKLYKIRDWETRYENAQSRKCEQLHWVPIPARHDAERYCELMARPDASEIFASWIICLQVGARSHPRGSLVRSDGSPHTPNSLAVKTRGHQKWFEKSLPYLTQIGWLEEFTTDSQSNTTSLPVDSHSGGQEGREGMNGKKEVEKSLNSQNTGNGHLKPKSKTFVASSEGVEVLTHLNVKAGTNFQPVAATVKFIQDRLSEGATVDQCKGVIDSKVKEWRSDPKMRQYLRPSTLFNCEKFSNYVGQISISEGKPQIKPFKE